MPGPGGVRTSHPIHDRPAGELTGRGWLGTRGATAGERWRAQAVTVELYRADFLCQPRGQPGFVGLGRLVEAEDLAHLGR